MHHHPHPPRHLSSAPKGVPTPPRTFAPFRSSFGARQRPSETGVSSGWARSASSPLADADFISIGKLEDNLQTMQRSVFEHLRPLDCSPSGGVAHGSASPGLVEDMNVLSVHEKDEADGEEKPPYSFACLIGMAILASEDKRLTVSEVYGWMKDNFPYFNSASAGTGWKNSVRHNLSLNKHFVKLNRDPDDHLHGKGSYWTVKAEAIPAMEAAIRKQEVGAAVASPRSRPRPLVSESGSFSQPRRAVRPTVKSRHVRRDSIEMDDATAATMLCSLGDPGATENGDTVMSTSPVFGGPAPPSAPRNAFPNLGRRRLNARAHTASTAVFPVPAMSRKSRTASATGHIKVAYSANPQKAPPKSGKAGTSVRSFNYVPSGSASFRRDLSSAGIAPAASDRLFTPKPPPSGAISSGHAVDDVELEDVSRPMRSPVSTAGGDRRFFTFSAPMSFSGGSPEARRYTPETGLYPERTPASQSMMVDSRGGESNQTSATTPPKTRRKLAIGADKRSESDTSAAAALLGLSGSSMMLCS